MLFLLFSQLPTTRMSNVHICDKRSYIILFRLRNDTHIADQKFMFCSLLVTSLNRITHELQVGKSTSTRDNVLVTLLIYVYAHKSEHA